MDSGVERTWQLSYFLMAPDRNADVLRCRTGNFSKRRSDSFQILVSVVTLEITTRHRCHVGEGFSLANHKLRERPLAELLTQTSADCLVKKNESRPTK